MSASDRVKLSERRKQAIWIDLCDEIGGRPSRRGSGLRPAIQVARRGWLITVDTFWGATGRECLRIRAPFVNWSGVRFTLQRRTAWSRVLGLNSGALPLLGAVYNCQTEDLEAVGGLFSSPHLQQELLRLQPGMVAISDDEGWSGPAYPAGVDVLLLYGSDDLGRSSVLSETYSLFLRVLEGLEALLSPEQDTEESLLRSLEGPSGQIIQEGVLLWDGNRLRLRAAGLLADRRCGAAVPLLARMLADRDLTLRIEVARALERLAGPECVPHLLPLLADERYQVAEAVELTLQRLGAGTWVTLFRRVVAGRADGAQLDGPYRDAFVEALAELVETADPQRTVDCARALAALRAVERLPEIHRALRRHGHYLVGIALESVIRELHALSALPRPALAPPPAAATLPRPSTAPEIDPVTLPRPAPAPEESR